MLLSMSPSFGDAYHGPTQIARAISEAWAEENLYCPACPSNSIRRLAHNFKSSDFQCGKCSAWYQLKSARAAFASRVPDGAYETMRKTIIDGNTPNLFLLNYHLESWAVQNLTVIPSFAFPLSCIECRPALSSTARRAGWVGCNILLTQIPPDRSEE